MKQVNLEKLSNVVKFVTQLPIKACEFKSSKRGSCTLDRLHVWVLVELGKKALSTAFPSGVGGQNLLTAVHHF